MDVPRRRIGVAKCFLIALTSAGIRLSHIAPLHAARPGDAAWSIKPRGTTTQQKPKAIAYREKEDFVVTQGSVFSVTPDPTFDWVMYHGNRLTQFRYLGPTGTGGIYDAIEIERQQRSLDPEKYRYHWGRRR